MITKLLINVFFLFSEMHSMVLDKIPGKCLAALSSYPMTEFFFTTKWIFHPILSKSVNLPSASSVNEMKRELFGF